MTTPFLSHEKLQALLHKQTFDNTLSIVNYPDARLYRQAKHVAELTPAIQHDALAMFHLHYKMGNCAALAATQLSFTAPWAITVIDFSADKNQPLCLINGEITHHEGTHTDEEGCMSVYPEAVHGKVTRAAHITVCAWDLFGAPIEFSAEGFMAKCIQHELDHLKGRLYLNHLSTLRRTACEKDIKFAQRQRQKQHKADE